MTSASGVATAQGAVERPVNLLMSGPVAGVVGGIWVGRQAGFDNVITLDVGGTSADIGLAQDGTLRMKHLLDTRVGPYQAMIPMVDVDTIGAGGGSIAYVDGGGIFRVGPALGRRRPGPRRLRPRRHRADVDRRDGQPRLAAARGLPRRRHEARRRARAHGVRGGGRAASACRSRRRRWARSRSRAHSMVQSIEENSVRKGFDPRDFALVAEGGAGPAVRRGHRARGRHAGRHRAALSRASPRRSGLLATDTVYEYVTTTYQRLSQLDAPALEARFDGARGPGARAARGRRHPRRAPRHPARGRLPLPRPGLRAAHRRRLGRDRRRLGRARSRADFHDAHEREYSRRFEELRHRDPEHPRARHRPDAELQAARARARAATSPDDALRHERQAWFHVDGELRELPTHFYARGALKAGNRIEGPAIVNQYDSTTVIPPGLTARGRPLRQHRHLGRPVRRRGSRRPARRHERLEEVADTMSSPTYEVGRPRRRRPASASRSTRSPLRVLGGAFHAIAKEMAGVLFRMSYSSIIRESEDLGAGHLRRAGPRAVRVGLDADAHRLAALVHPRLPRPPRRATSTRATSSSTTTRTSGRRTAPTSRWRCRSSTRASCSASRP